MRITSIDQKSWVEIARQGNADYSSFTVSCAVDIGHGSFAGRNIDVQFLNLPEPSP